MDANNSCSPHTFLNLVGSYTCSCGEGYQQSTNGMNCEDINECSLFESNSCGSHQCINESGSYRCVCNEGFQLVLNNISCHDTDECMNANNSCTPHECLNLVGSYTCLCAGKYQLDTNEHNNIKPSDGTFCIPISNQASNAMATDNSNGTFIGVIVFLIIMIIVLILLLITSLSIIIYMCYNKRNTKVKFQELPDYNQSEGKEYIELDTADVAAYDQRDEPNYSQIPPAMSYKHLPDDISQYEAMK